jgi:mycofactocin precursor
MAWAPSTTTTVVDTAAVDTAVRDADEIVGTDELVAADTLVEDVSIDGMCGVY